MKTDCKYVNLRNLNNQENSKTDFLNESSEKTFECVKEILGLDFYGIFDYFDKILRKEFQYIVLMSRRCLVLYQLYTTLFEKQMEDIQKKSIVMSDKALPYYWPFLEKNSKLAIVDDIVVHGRTVCKIYDLIENERKDIEIQIFGYTANQDVDCIPESLNNIFNISYFSSTNEWRKLSNHIVDAIIASNIPYTSFITSFFQYKVPSLMDALRKREGLIVVENTDVTQKEQGVLSYCVYEKNWEKPELFKEISLGECIRFYWNQKIEKLTVIPYVFIKTLTETEMQALERQCEVSLQEDFVHTNEMLRQTYCGAALENSEKTDMEKQLKDYKMRLFTCILSNYYWKRFLSRYDMPTPEFTDEDTLNKSFGKPVAKELLCVNESNIKKLISSGIGVSLNENKKSVSAYKERKEDWIRDYFFKAWVEDESRAQKKEERVSGMLLDTFVSMVWGESPKSFYNMLAKLVNCWDVGIAAANYSYHANKKTIGCYITPGEQSYKIMLEQNPIVINSLIEVSNLVTRSDAKRENKTFEEFRTDMVLELLERFQKAGQVVCCEEIKEVVRMTKGYLNGWMQEQLLCCYLRAVENKNDILEQFIEDKF